MKRILALLALTTVTTGVTVMAYEAPRHETLGEHDGYELRRYEPYLVAETDVHGDFRESGSAAFSILAGYIFGENRPAAVLSQQSERPESIKMAMTVPVLSTEREAREGDEHSQDGGKRFVYSFVMPSKFSLDTLPVPIDPGIEIRRVPAHTVAVRRFSGRWTEANYRKHEAELLSALERDGHRVAGKPKLARYNGPWTPWFMRRNEILVELAMVSSRTRTAETRAPVPTGTSHIPSQSPGA